MLAAPTASNRFNNPRRVFVSWVLDQDNQLADRWVKAFHKKAQGLKVWFQDVWVTANGQSSIAQLAGDHIVSTAELRDRCHGLTDVVAVLSDQYANLCSNSDFELHLLLQNLPDPSEQTDDALWLAPVEEQFPQAILLPDGRRLSDLPLHPMTPDFQRFNLDPQATTVLDREIGTACKQMAEHRHHACATCCPPTP